MSGGGTQSLARLLCAKIAVYWDERFNDQPNGATSDTGETAWSMTPATAQAGRGVEANQHELRLSGAVTWHTAFLTGEYAGPVLIQFVIAEHGNFNDGDRLVLSYQIGTGPQVQFALHRDDEPIVVDQAVVDVPANASITLRAVCDTDNDQKVFEISRVVVRSIGQGVSWHEDFEDLGSGASIDNGATAWSRSITSGFGQVTTAGGVKGFYMGRVVEWLSESIGLSNLQNGSLAVYARVRTASTNHEASDTLTGEYQIDGGSWVQFFHLTGSFNEFVTKFVHLNGVSANAVRVRVTCQSSVFNERFLIDEVGIVAHC